MLFADFSHTFGTGCIIMMLMIAVSIHFGKKYLKDNSDVKDTLKKAAANKAVELIGRFFKK